MATTTASINITSGDIMDNNVSISSTATLTTAGTTTGLTETTGLARRKFAAASLVDLITMANTEVTELKSAKVYIRNTNSYNAEQYVLVGIGNSSGTPLYMGRLYGGDWMFFPWEALPTDADGRAASLLDGGTEGHAANEDITVTPSHADPVVLEYMVFFE